MSAWPPPQQPAPQPPQQQPPYQSPVTPAARAGCARAFIVTLLIGGLMAVIVGMLFSDSTSSTYLPVLEDSVAVIRIEGTITDSADTVKLIRRMRKSSMVKAIVLRLETPGGGVGASEEIYREALKTRTENKKLLVASMGDVAASGGYYIASATDKIYATSGTITGSIGVIAPSFNFTHTLQKLGVKENAIASGEHKNTGNPFDEQTTSERTLLQGVINDMYRQFFTVVLQARHEAVGRAAKTPEFEAVINPAGTKVPGMGVEWSTFTTGTVAKALGLPIEQEDALRRLADGRVYTGEQALKVGLVDNIGTLQDAIDYAGRETGLGEDPPTMDRTPGSEVSSILGASARKFLQEATAAPGSIEYRSNF